MSKTAAKAEGVFGAFKSFGAGVFSIIFGSFAKPNGTLFFLINLNHLLSEQL